MTNRLDPYQLHHGPYTPPAVRGGDRATCLFRDGDVVIPVEGTAAYLGLLSSPRKPWTEWTQWTELPLGGRDHRRPGNCVHSVQGLRDGPAKRGWGLPAVPFQAGVAFPAQPLLQEAPEQADAHVFSLQ